MNDWQKYRTDPFTDLLFNALLGFTFLFLVAVMLINPEARTGLIDPKAEYILSIRWADFSEDDIDIWVENPEGHLLWFKNSEVGLLHLDRDDRGKLNDTIVVAGEEIENPLNQEVVTLRGVIRGEYTANLHYYASASKEPVDVDIRLDKVNPTLKVVYYGKVRLDQQDDEKTAVRFRVNADGEVSNVHFTPRKLVQRVR